MSNKIILKTKSNTQAINKEKKRRIKKYFFIFKDGPQIGLEREE